MNALLIYPEIPDTFWSFKHAVKFLRKKASLPPLGLLTVAAMLPARWEKRLVDLNVAKLSDEDLAWADWAFISGMAIQKEAARRLIERCKERGVTVVGGGPLFTCEPERFEDVDHLILNEAEVTLPLFLADLEQGRAERVYTASRFADMDESPTPLWELLDMKQYASMSIQFSRGCPFQCEFCNVTALFGHKPRTKGAAQIIAELNGLYDRGWRASVFFADDNFIGNKRSLKNELLPALIRWRQGKRGISFYTEVSINLADDEELMRLMTEAGFDTVFIGIETPVEASLNECNKMQNKNRDLLADVKKLQHHGLQVQGGFIIGFDSDTPSIFHQHTDFIGTSGIVVAMVGILQAPAGTKLYQKMQEMGRLLNQMTGDNVDGTTNIVPAMSMETLRNGYKSILQNLYAPENYYRRIRTFFKEYKPPKKSKSFGPGYLMAFFRSVYYLGIRGKERVSYWKLLLWTTFHSPSLFPLAVKLAIYGHHLRKVCEQRIV